MIWQLINQDVARASGERRRVSLEMGVPTIVAPSTTLMLLADRCENRYLIAFELQRIGQSAPDYAARLFVKRWTRLAPLCPLDMLPRAVRYDMAGRPTALLMEFATRPARATHESGDAVLFD